MLSKSILGTKLTFGSSFPLNDGRRIMFHNQREWLAMACIWLVPWSQTYMKFVYKFSFHKHVFPFVCNKRFYVFEQVQSQ